MVQNIYSKYILAGVCWKTIERMTNFKIILADSCKPGNSLIKCLQKSEIITQCVVMVQRCRQCAAIYLTLQHAQVNDVIIQRLKEIQRDNKNVSKSSQKGAYNEHDASANSQKVKIPGGIRNIEL